MQNLLLGVGIGLLGALAALKALFPISMKQVTVCFVGVVEDCLLSIARTRDSKLEWVH
jgi:hypothetical protein